MGGRGKLALDLGPVSLLRRGLPVGVLIVLKEFSPSSVARVLGELGKFRLIRVIASESEGKGLCYAILDAEGRLRVLERIAERLRKAKGIESVEVYRPLSSPTGGLLVEVPYEELTFSGIRIMVLTQPAFGIFVKALRKTLGESGPAILYHMGFVMGKSALKGHSSLPSIRGRLDVAMEVTRQFLRASGIGRVEVLRLDRHSSTARVRVFDNFECELFAGSGAPASHFVRGVVAGWLSAYMGRELRAEETRCIAAGDEFCEFVVEPLG